MERQLKDKIFISTRPTNKSDELLGLFENAGATLLEMPMIKILPAELTNQELSILNELESFEWLIFTSPNGVQSFFHLLSNVVGNKKLPQSLKIAVVGDKTEHVLNEFDYQASFKNPGSTGEDFADFFFEELKQNSSKPNVLLAFGNLARQVIQNKLSELANCTRVNVYRTTNTATIDKKLIRQIEENKYALLIFTSPSGIKNFIRLKKNIQTENLRIARIGETTAKEAIQNNITPLVIAKNSTALDLFKSISDYYKK